MKSARFFVYMNIEPLAAAWAAYRGQMCSASSIGTRDFRPIAYWPYGLLKGAARGCARSLQRLEKEIAIEQVRREYYPQQVSRLHGIYVWGTEEDAIRGEKWREKEGLHFDRENLVEVGFGYTNLSKVDTQWIDYFLINDDYRLNRANLSWAHSYWSGKKWDDNPHWELLVEGRGTIWGTVLRMRALEKIEAGWRPSC
jgi:hypothetical protein